MNSFLISISDNDWLRDISSNANLSLSNKKPSFSHDMHLICLARELQRKKNKVYFILEEDYINGIGIGFYSDEFLQKNRFLFELHESNNGYSIKKSEFLLEDVLYLIDTIFSPYHFISNFKDIKNNGDLTQYMFFKKDIFSRRVDIPGNQFYVEYFYSKTGKFIRTPKKPIKFTLYSAGLYFVEMLSHYDNAEFYNILLDTIFLFDAVIVQNIRQKEFLNFFISLLTGNSIEEKIFVFNSIKENNLLETFESKAFNEIPPEEKFPDLFNHNTFKILFSGGFYPWTNSEVILKKLCNELKTNKETNLRIIIAGFFPECSRKEYSRKQKELEKFLANQGSLIAYSLKEIDIQTRVLFLDWNYASEIITSLHKQSDAGIDTSEDKLESFLRNRVRTSYFETFRMRPIIFDTDIPTLIKNPIIIPSEFTSLNNSKSLINEIETQFYETKINYKDQLNDDFKFDELDDFIKLISKPSNSLAFYKAAKIKNFAKRNSFLRG